MHNTVQSYHNHGILLDTESDQRGATVLRVLLCFQRGPRDNPTIGMTWLGILYWIHVFSWRLTLWIGTFWAVPALHVIKMNQYLYGRTCYTLGIIITDYMDRGFDLPHLFPFNYQVGHGFSSGLFSGYSPSGAATKTDVSVNQCVCVCVCFEACSHSGRSSSTATPRFASRLSLRILFDLRCKDTNGHEDTVAMWQAM